MDGLNAASAFTHVIVPLDGSVAAEKALLAATRLARASGAVLHLIRAIPADREGAAAADVGHLRPIDQLAADAESYLQRVAIRLRADHLDVRATLWRGDAAEGILALAQTDPAALVLLASEGRTSRGRWLLGSVSRRVLREAPVPVLLLRRDRRPLPSPSPYSALPRTALQVLVPLDGTPAAEMALRPAIELLGTLAAPGEARLHLVHVVPTFGGDWGLDELQARAYLQTLGDRVASQMPRDLGISVTWSVLFETEPAPAIIRLAAMGDSHSAPANVIAMTTGGNSSGGRILGSVAEQVLHGTRLPVVVIRQDAVRISDGTDHAAT